MLYISRKSACADHRLTEGMSRRSQTKADNPMKANARHVPSSPRSRRTPLSRSGTCPRRLQAVPEKSVPNPCKSDHFRKVQFFNRSTSTTYHFNALKCPDFQARGLFPLPRAAETKSLAAHGASLGQGEGQTGHCFCPRFLNLQLTGDLPNLAFCTLNSALRRCNLFANYCTEANATERFTISFDFDHAVPTIYDDALPSRSILMPPVADEVTSLTLKNLGPAEFHQKTCAKTVPFLCHFPGAVAIGVSSCASKTCTKLVRLLYKRVGGCTTFPNPASRGLADRSLTIEPNCRTGQRRAVETRRRPSQRRGAP